LERPKGALSDARRARALGLSTDISTAHLEGLGRPIPARGTTPDERSSRMSAVASRVLSWNPLVIDAQVPERMTRQHSLSRHACSRGGRIVALLMPLERAIANCAPG
jgi:hypothetical protein